jgi:hypothetical protein
MRTTLSVDGNVPKIMLLDAERASGEGVVFLPLVFPLGVAGAAGLTSRATLISAI